VRWLPIGLLVVAASFVSGSFLLHPTDLHLPACSEPWDAAIYPWNFFWLAESFGAPDGSLLFTRRFYWPHGEGLGLYTPTWVYGVLSLPFQWLGGEPQSRHVAVAALLWLSSVATALLAYALARELGRARSSSLFFALFVTAASGRLMNAARLNLFCTELLLLFLLAGLALWKRGGAARGTTLGFAAALLLLQSQPLFFQAALLCALLLCAALLRARARRRLRELLRPLSAAAAVFLLLAGPFLYEMAIELPRSPGIAQAAALTRLGSLDLGDLLLPNAADRLAAAYATILPLRQPSFFEDGGPLGTVSHFLGIGLSALLLAGAAARGATGARRSLLLGLALLSLAAGPMLTFRGRALAPMPYALLSLAPPLALEKSPARLVWLVQLCFALAAAQGLERLSFAADGTRRRRTAAAGAVLALLALLEQGETAPLRSVEPRLRIPDEAAALAREPGSFAVLDLPFDSRPPFGEVSHGVNALAMAFGAAHERPIFFGLYPRAARSREAELARRPLFAAIHRMEASARGGAPAPVFTEEELSAVRADLADLSIGAVQLHQPSFVPERPPGSGERARLLGFLRSLRPAGEVELRPGKGYSVALFRF
jgi:hypothetical protein